jgi:amidase
MTDLYALGAAAAARRTRPGTLSPVDLLDACLARIFLTAQAHRRRFREEMARVAAPYEALLSPTVAAPAPRGLQSTGDPSVCAPWSVAGMPAIALPTGLPSDGLPLSVQLVGRVWGEAGLLAAAAWREQEIGFKEAPGA